MTIGVANNRATPLLQEAESFDLSETGRADRRLDAHEGGNRPAYHAHSAVVPSRDPARARLRRSHGGRAGLEQETGPKERKILSRLTGRGDEEIHEALRQTGGSVKLAFLLLQGFALGEAEAALDEAEGHLRRAMSLIVERSKGTGLIETRPSFREHATHE